MSRYHHALPNDLENLRDRLREFAEARNWGQWHSPRNFALALTGEVGELAAELQWVSDLEMPQYLNDPEARRRLSDEAADVLIYLVQFADVCGIDLVAEAHSKIDRNEARYPPHVGGPKEFNTASDP
jgi:dCTP diphosphatase